MSDTKFKELQDMFEDYSEFLDNDKEVQDNLMYLLGRYIQTGQDLTDYELNVLKTFIQSKIDKFVKEKVN